MGGDAYDYRRAEAELAMAQRAGCAEARRAHYELANRYFDRFFNPAAPQPSPRMAVPAGTGRDRAMAASAR